MSSRGRVCGAAGSVEIRTVIMSKKLNCWELMACGRQPNGTRSKELGVCPAATESRVDGVNGGSMGGRCCWAIAGTLCNGEIQGTFARKSRACKECRFYLAVREEEGLGFCLTGNVLAMLKEQEQPPPPAPR